MNKQRIGKEVCVEIKNNTIILTDEDEEVTYMRIDLDNATIKNLLKYLEAHKIELNLYEENLSG